MAAEAGVSTATVSRAVSGRGPVGEQTRKRVMDVVERLGYQPNSSARGLRGAPTMLLAVVVPNLANPMFVSFLRGVGRVAQERGYSVLVIDTQRSPAVERQALDRLLARRVDAVLLGGPVRDRQRLSELESAGALVADTSQVSGPYGIDLARLERPATGQMCAELARLGHRRLHFVSGRSELGPATRGRWADVQSACRRAGVRAVRVAVRSGDDVVSAFHLRPDAAPPTAIVCGGHLLAPVVLQGLAAARVELPGDCSFVTYGDSDWALAFRPALSVVSLDLHAVACSLTRRLLSELEGESPQPAEPLPPAQFHRRESIGPAR